MLGASLQRKTPGEAVLKLTLWLRGTVTMVLEMGKVIPPSVERDHITLLVAVMTPQHEPRCQAATTVPSGSMASDGYSLWFVLLAASLETTRGTKVLQLAPWSVLLRTPTVS